MKFHGFPPHTAHEYSLRQHGPDARLSVYFRLIEFACRDGSDLVLVHPRLVMLLDQVRIRFRAPVTITSAFRTRTHNRTIGGATHSRHLYGLAADIQVRGVHPDKVARFAEILNPGGLGRYNTFTHLDVEGEGRRWDRRTLPSTLAQR